MYYVFFSLWTKRWLIVRSKWILKFMNFRISGLQILREVWPWLKAVTEPFHKIIFFLLASRIFISYRYIINEMHKDCHLWGKHLLIFCSNFLINFPSWINSIIFKTIGLYFSFSCNFKYLWSYVTIKIQRTLLHLSSYLKVARAYLKLILKV